MLSRNIMKRTVRLSLLQHPAAAHHDDCLRRIIAEGACIRKYNHRRFLNYAALHNSCLTSTISSDVKRKNERLCQRYQSSLPNINLISTTSLRPNNIVRGNYISMNNNNTIIQRRSITTDDMGIMLTELTSNLPSIWGFSGMLLQTIHCNGIVPYWACMSIINIMVRTSLFPFVLQAAHTSIKFGKVSSEIQFLITIFTKDLQNLRARKASITEQRHLILSTLKTLRGIYKLHGIHPFAIFKSPLIQIPIFYYFSIDLRKLINGGNPELAQELTESTIPFLPYVKDLTDPDPFYTLPILGGVLLYANVEVALGKKALSGNVTSKSNFAIMMKDFFQSLGIFMPCFMAQSPAAMQIYLCTSFVFTMGQSYALRNDTFRQVVGLPTTSISQQKTEPKYATEFIKLKELEHKAREIRKEIGDDTIYGEHGILQDGLEVSFVGKRRSSTIGVVVEKEEEFNKTTTINTIITDKELFELSLSIIESLNRTNEQINTSIQITNVDNTPKVYATPQIQDVTSSSAAIDKQETVETKTSTTNNSGAAATTKTTTMMKTIERSPEEMMEAANRGELLQPITTIVDDNNDTSGTGSTTTTNTNTNRKKFVNKKMMRKTKNLKKQQPKRNK